MKPSEKLAELGIELPAVAKPLAAYVPAAKVGNQVWTSGQLPVVDGKLTVTGKVGAEVSPEIAKGQAKLAILNALAAAADVAGGIDNIARICKIVIFVASDPAFTGQPAVGNGASETLGEIFGEQGVHVRSAVGVSALPMDAPVEIELVCELA
ncbi:MULTISPECIES: RidA family protein [unclassified Luteococcus]|uniref:RidA family protein n=1 Tax=unclassified Luteococcus TaxID=2639923 RepID=UPI00313E3954